MHALPKKRVAWVRAVGSAERELTGSADGEHARRAGPLDDFSEIRTKKQFA